MLVVPQERIRPHPPVPVRMLHHSMILNIRDDSYRLNGRSMAGLPWPSEEDSRDRLGSFRGDFAERSFADRATPNYATNSGLQISDTPSIAARSFPLQSRLTTSWRNSSATYLKLKPLQAQLVPDASYASSE